VACRQVRDKRQLVRVVRTPDGTIRVDPTGKLSGRGAYLCRQKSCWHDGLARKSLDRALKVTLDDTDLQLLSGFAQDLPDEMDNE
jgi:predicted RNA-binding protein YlxR (DUF448 family)